MKRLQNTPDTRKIVRSKQFKTGRHDYFAYADELILGLNADGRYGTAQTYTRATSSFRHFLAEVYSDSSTSGLEMPSLTVEDMDDILIYKYNRYLSSRRVIRNSISFYNRVLRAIYNKAIKKWRIPDKHPFSEVYTGIDRTRNRAVSEKSISKLLSLDLRNDKSLELTRDLFILSYALRGIPFVDMAYLTKSDIRGGYLTYVRKKTGTLMEVRIEPQIQYLIDKYSMDDSEYLLPILRDAESKQTASCGRDGVFFEDNGRCLYRRYQAKLSVYNRNLKTLARLIHEQTTMTSYVSRHSWATAARNSNVSMSIISEGLGHSSEKMTRIYLGSLDKKLVDVANKKLMQRIKMLSSLQ